MNEAVVFSQPLDLHACRHNTSPLFPNSSNYWEWLKSGRGQLKFPREKRTFQNPRSAAPCPDVEQIIHLGAPNDTESYIQETGRGGRDGRLCLASLLVVNRNNLFHSQEIKDYQVNTSGGGLIQVYSNNNDLACSYYL